MEKEKQTKQMDSPKIEPLFVNLAPIYRYYRMIGSSGGLPQYKKKQRMLSPENARILWYSICYQLVEAVKLRWARMNLPRSYMRWMKRVSIDRSMVSTGEIAMTSVGVTTVVPSLEQIDIQCLNFRTQTKQAEQHPL